MIVRSIDATGRWNWGKGRNDYRSGILATSQSIRTRLLSVLGNCFFATNVGIDWFNLLGGKNQLALELAVSTTILNTDGVTGLQRLSVNLDRNTREFTATYRVQTVYGPVENTFQYDLGSLA